jgi:hypothetical protein
LGFRLMIFADGLGAEKIQDTAEKIRAIALHINSLTRGRDRL